MITKLFITPEKQDRGGDGETEVRDFTRGYESGEIDKPKKR